MVLKITKFEKGNEALNLTCELTSMEEVINTTKTIMDYIFNKVEENCVVDSPSAMEHNLIKSEMDSGDDNYHKKGGVDGRKKRTPKSDAEYTKQYPKEIYLLGEGKTLQEVQALTGTSITTLSKLRAKFVA